jgi:hypothetical protein
MAAREGEGVRRVAVEAEVMTEEIEAAIVVLVEALERSGIKVGGVLVSIVEFTSARGTGVHMYPYVSAKLKMWQTMGPKEVLLKLFEIVKDSIEANAAQLSAKKEDN